MTAFHRRHLRKREERRNGIQKRGTVKRIESVFKSVRRAVYTDVFSSEKKREYTETLDAKNDDAIISPRLLPASKYEKANSPTFPSRRVRKKNKRCTAAIALLTTALESRNRENATGSGRESSSNVVKWLTL
uniref:Uncharacterized protein n=1 Tax=Vespula pensylvanica TaxID=30213 RepID=A0A834P3V5_VESPE|nr:hypothetical protein H0235_007029 [Vespula pensylvanica]